MKFLIQIGLAQLRPDKKKKKNRDCGETSYSQPGKSWPWRKGNQRAAHIYRPVPIPPECSPAWKATRRRSPLTRGCYCVRSIKQTSHPPNLGCLFYHSIPRLTQIQRVSGVCRVLWRFPLLLSAHNSSLPFWNLMENTRMSAGPSGTFCRRFSKASSNKNEFSLIIMPITHIRVKRKIYIVYHFFRAPVMNRSGCCTDKTRNQHHPKKAQSPQLRPTSMFKAILFSFPVSKMGITGTTKLKYSIFQTRREVY